MDKNTYQESISTAIKEAIYSNTIPEERENWGLGEIFAQDFNGIPGTVIVINGTKYQGQVFMLYDQALDLFSVMAYDPVLPTKVRDISQGRVTILTAIELINQLVS